MSRREFLKRVGGTAALGLLPFSAGFFAETSRAWSKEVKDGDSWLEGLQALRDEALNANTEKSALFIEDKKGKKYWKHFAAGDEKTATISGETLTEEFSKNHRDIKLAHTHFLGSLKEFNITEEDIKKIRSGEAPTPAIPLSIKDITEIILFQKQLEEQGMPRKIPSLIIDPRGVWEYTVDTKHSFAEEFLAYHEKSYAQLQMLYNEPVVQKTIVGNPDITNSFDLLEHLKKHEMENLPQNIQWLVQGMIVDYTSFVNAQDPVIAAVHREGKKHLWNSFNNINADPEALLARYKRDIGITATFTSHKELGLE